MKAAGCMPPKPGRVISSTPPKPKAIADQRRQPIHSPSIGPDAMATMNGKVKMIDSASSSCSQRSARKLRMVEATSSSERMICSFSRPVRSRPGCVSGLDTISVSTKALV